MTEHVRVRMYDVGFGDGFLIEFPVAESRPFRVLVDCGAHSSGYPREGWRPEIVVDQIIADIIDDDRANGVNAANDEAHIDVVIATHRHQDHVSGFRAAAWESVSVGEVWMPWTEHPTDRKAARIRNTQSRLALGLQGQLTLRGAAANSPVSNLVVNALTNEAAMQTLHKGFKGRPRRRFISSSKDRTIEPPECPGLVVHVLGPSRDEDVIRDMDPPAGASYLRFAESGDNPSAPQPFAEAFTFTHDRYAEGWPHLVLGDQHGGRVKSVAADMVSDDEFAVAVALDRAVNGTSLMLMFEFGDAYLLFPGDAQWGTWRAALDNEDHRQLLGQTTFLKVGHHGSHNATPKEMIETVLKDRTLWGAAASVHPVDKWPQIPKGDLMTALDGVAERVRRSDQPGRSGKGVKVRQGIGIDFSVPCA